MVDASPGKLSAGPSRLPLRFHASAIVSIPRREDDEDDDEVRGESTPAQAPKRQSPRQAWRSLQSSAMDGTADGGSAAPPPAGSDRPSDPSGVASPGERELSASIPETSSVTAQDSSSRVDTAQL